MDILVSIAPAIITGFLSLIGVIISNMQANKKVEQKLTTSQAVTDCKIDELTREVRAHNNFASRMPVVEEQISELARRVDVLESK